MEEKKPIPIWEIAITLFSLYVCALFFFFPSILAEQNTALFFYMDEIADQSLWAFLFCFSAAMKVVGIFLNNCTIRIAGLVFSALLYGTIAICYMLSFPNIGTGLFIVITFMCIMQAFYVKATEL